MPVNVTTPETYIQVKGKWTYLYPAVDKFGRTFTRHLIDNVENAKASPAGNVVVNEIQVPNGHLPDRYFVIVLALAGTVQSNRASIQKEVLRPRCLATNPTTAGPIKTPA
jgi:hypothetical protein